MVAEKSRQAFEFGSRAWARHYAGRSAIERVFSGVKDKAGEDVSRGRIRVMGRARVQLLRTIAYGARNLRIARASVAQPTRLPPPKRRPATYADLIPDVA